MALDLWTAFAAERDEKYALRRRRLAELETSGRIGAADPLITGEVAPFTARVPKGRWPVEVLLASRNTDSRVALARVVFRDVAPARFALAVCDGQDVRTLRADEHFGYGVDAGTGCFADASATFEGETIVAQLDRTYTPTWSWAVGGDASWVAFSSGYGDGI